MMPKGGAREGAGRPSNDYPRQLLSVQATPGEYAEIIAALDTRARTDALLAAAREKKGEDDG